MDQDLYDEFGNYIGPEMADSDEEASGGEDEYGDEDADEEQKQELALPREASHFLSQMKMSR